ncbi:hypothetical protein SDC9_59967 [bioreactor metagenome]|uniref:Uncharacterized protein n=1 Tax=bioreactor metagenome TaxID=1076179 RepID=A0A644XBW8_9ZZZZ
MITLKQILEAEFADANLEEISSLLQQHNLYVLIEESLGLINTHLKLKSKEIKTFGFSQISHIAAGVLIRINEYLHLLEYQQRTEEEENISYLCSSIFRRCLQILVIKMPEKSRELFSKSLYITLQDTCRLYGYDFNQLLQIFSILVIADEKQAIQSAPSSQKPKSKYKDLTPYYEWEGNKAKFDLFISLFSKYEICADTELDKIKLLFSIQFRNLSINLNVGNRRTVLQFFFYLKNNGFVSFHNCGGFYQVLQYHVIDYDAVFLKNGDPQRANGNQVRHSSWNTMKKLFENDLKALF